MIQVAEEVLIGLRAVWRRRWIAVGTAWVAALIGIFVVYGIPNRYEASSKIYVDTQTVLKPLMQGLAFQPDTDQQVRMLARTLVSRPNVDKLLKAPGVDAPTTGEEHERAIDRMIDRIKIDSSGGNLYVISVRDADPARAKAVVTALVNLFVGNGNDAKQHDSSEAGTFIDEQIKVYETKLTDTENRLKDFKIRNFGVSGVSNQDYYSRTSSISDEVTRLQIAYSAAAQSRDALRRELASEDPRLPPDALAANGAGAAPSELDTRIDGQRKQLDELLRKYTEAHPDVISARQTIRQLEAQRAAERAALASGKANGAAATSPVFQRIRVSLADAEANVASLGAQLGAQQKRLADIRSTASKVPQAEAELAQLNRDYDVIRKNYDLLVARREAASLGVKMDQSEQLADFRVIEPPRVSPTAVFPDRKALAFGAMFASLALGLAVAYGLSLLFPTFSSAKPLEELSRRPVIGSISVYTSKEIMVSKSTDLRRVMIAMGVFFLVQGVWVVLVATRIGHLP